MFYLCIRLSTTFINCLPFLPVYMLYLSSCFTHVPVVPPYTFYQCIDRPKYSIFKSTYFTCLPLYLYKPSTCFTSLPILRAYPFYLLIRFTSDKLPAFQFTSGKLHSGLPQVNYLPFGFIHLPIYLFYLSTLFKISGGEFSLGEAYLPIYSQISRSTKNVPRYTFLLFSMPQLEQYNPHKMKSW